MENQEQQNNLEMIEITPLFKGVMTVIGTVIAAGIIGVGTMVMGMRSDISEVRNSVSEMKVRMEEGYVKRGDFDALRDKIIRLETQIETLQP